MSDLLELIVFLVDHHRFALPASAVERVVSSVEVTPLPGAPAITLGVINVKGVILPVFGMRRRLGLPDGDDVRLSDQFIIARTARRSVVLVVDQVEGFVPQHASDMTMAIEILPGGSNAHGVLRLPDGLVVVHDMDRFLSLEEDEALQRAIADRNDTA